VSWTGSSSICNLPWDVRLYHNAIMHLFSQSSPDTLTECHRPVTFNVFPNRYSSPSTTERFFKVKQKQAIIEKDCHFLEPGGAWRELQLITLTDHVGTNFQPTVQTKDVVQDIRRLTVQLLESTNFLEDFGVHSFKTYSRTHPYPTSLGHYNDTWIPFEMVTIQGLNMSWWWWCCCWWWYNIWW